LVDNFLLSQGKAKNVMFCSIFVTPRLCQVWQRLVKFGMIVDVLIGSAKDSSFLLNITYYQKVSDMVESNELREDTHKKSGFLSGRTTKVLPSLHQWLKKTTFFMCVFPNSLTKCANSLQKITTLSELAHF